MPTIPISNYVTAWLKAPFLTYLKNSILIVGSIIVAGKVLISAEVCREMEIIHRKGKTKIRTTKIFSSVLTMLSIFSVVLYMGRPSY